MSLESRRKKIDEIDAEIVEILARRMKVVDELIDYKKNKNMDIFDQERELQIISNVRKIAERENLDPDFIEEIFSKILEKSKHKE
jgi:chorismate mutase